MSDIRFYVPESESIPTDLRLYVDDVYVIYERINCGFVFSVSLDDEEVAMRVVEEIISKIKAEHDEAQHGVTWVTQSIKVIPQDERYRVTTKVEWKFRVRDSY